MHIHTVQNGDTIYKIAKDYDTTPTKICENNGIENKNHLSVGRELLILMPTRTYTVKQGDTLSGIAMRFGIKLKDLITANPKHIGNDKLSVGEVLCVRTNKKKYGTSVSNGYFYNGCSQEKLQMAMPFMTYVTVASIISGNAGLKELFFDREIINTIKKSGKIPLVRIYETGNAEKYLNKGKRREFIDQIINISKEKGYSGIVLCAFDVAEKAPEEFCEFVLELRKRMIGCDLVLFTEIDETSPAAISDISDGSIFIYDNLMMDNPPSFNDGLKAIMTDFATKCESSKVFLDIPSLAFSGGKYISYDDALTMCYKRGGEITFDKETLISHFKHGSQTVRFESVKSTKAKLDAISELGFMGISFDIMRTPMSTLMMYGELYKILAYQVCYSDM